MKQTKKCVHSATFFSMLKCSNILQFGTATNSPQFPVTGGVSLGDISETGLLEQKVNRRIFVSYCVFLFHLNAHCMWEWLFTSVIHRTCCHTSKSYTSVDENFHSCAVSGDEPRSTYLPGHPNMPSFLCYQYSNFGCRASIDQEAYDPPQPRELQV